MWLSVTLAFAMLSEGLRIVPITARPVVGEVMTNLFLPVNGGTPNLASR